MQLKINVIQCTQYDSSTFLRSPPDFSAHSFPKTYLFRTKWELKAPRLERFMMSSPSKRMYGAWCQRPAKSAGPCMLVYLYISWWCPPWRHLVCDVTEHLAFPGNTEECLAFLGVFLFIWFLAAVLGVGKCFLQWISKAKVLLRAHGSDSG